MHQHPSFNTGPCPTPENLMLEVGSGTMVPFSRVTLTDAFQELSRQLRIKGVKAHLYVIGGGAISLSFDKRRMTMDLDALVLKGHGPLMDAVRRVGRKRGWPESWLNEQAASALPRTRDGRARTAYGDANLIVTTASAKHLLAMKIRAGREQGLDDITLLVRHLGLQSVEDVVALHDEVFPDQSLPDGLHADIKQHLASLWHADEIDDRPGTNQNPARKHKEHVR